MTFRCRDNTLLEFTETQITDKYRLSAEDIYYKCQIVCNDLERRTRRGHALPVFQIVLSSLSYLSTGGYMSLVADRILIDKGTVSRCLWQFCNALGTHHQEFVSFPEAEATKVTFQEKAGRSIMCYLY